MYLIKLTGPKGDNFYLNTDKIMVIREKEPFSKEGQTNWYRSSISLQAEGWELDVREKVSEILSMIP